MSVADETGKALFVCFDEVMTKHHNMRAFEADHLLAGDGVNPEETQAPPFVSLKFTANHQTFTVSRILSERDRVLQPAFVDNLRFMECKEATFTMDMTTPMPSQYLLRWKLVDLARGR
ncbi:unnamed protein product [Brassica rapa]|uniref:Replication factor A C-terminal domain-containing protein n=1 Tax=Brassica campestris TaxID=3711 RepID=A0A8D9M6Z9_BRACM|nr:unnamed protein product [Brassica rapa]